MKKLADILTDKLPQPDLPPTKFRKEIEQKINQLDESIVTAKNGRYYAIFPQKKLESFTVNKQNNIYPSFC
jgi:hypothetical protein